MLGSSSTDGRDVCRGSAADAARGCRGLAWSIYLDGNYAGATIYGNVCPFTGAPADDAKLVRAGTGGGCPFAAFQARDFALVACLFLALSLATHLLTPAAA